MVLGVNDQVKDLRSFYGNGKLLLTAEYFVLDGAVALALPATLGQKMEVKRVVNNSKSLSEKTLKWSSFGHDGKLWLSANYTLINKNLILTSSSISAKAEYLCLILAKAKELNPSFLEDEGDTSYSYEVKTFLEFPLNWGLGASSTLIYNIASFANIDPFLLLSHTVGGSGYDIACAESKGPILFKREGEKEKTPVWESVTFLPNFSHHLYFIYSGQKQSTADAISWYQKNNLKDDKLIEKISILTHQFLKATNLDEFESLIREHEEIVSKFISHPRIKTEKYQDFWGEVKSLGAWGGDFLLVTSNRSYEETKEYFYSKGHLEFIPFKELVRISHTENHK